MPRKTRKPRKAGITRAMSDSRTALQGRTAPTRDPVRHLRTQTKGGRPPRFPGRTGGR